jgi:hypothetical protein
MSERLVMVAMHARPRVWEVLSERMCELAPLLEHIETAALERRATTDDGTVHCTHRWRARPNVPGILAQHIDQGLLEWTTDTEWRPADYASRWVVRPRSMKGAALCEGTLVLFPPSGARAHGSSLSWPLSRGNRRQAGAPSPAPSCRHTSASSLTRQGDCSTRTRQRRWLERRQRAPRLAREEFDSAPGQRAVGHRFRARLVHQVQAE